MKTHIRKFHEKVMDLINDQDLMAKIFLERLKVRHEP